MILRQKDYEIIIKCIELAIEEDYHQLNSMELDYLKDKLLPEMKQYMGDYDDGK